MVLGLGTKGPRILRGLLCSIKTFCPLFFPPTDKHRLCRLPTHIQARTLHHPVSETPPVSRGRFMGSGRVRRVPSSLGGVSQLHLYSKEPLGGVKNKPVGAKGLTHLKTLCLPFRRSRAAALSKKESLQGEVGVFFGVSSIFISAWLMKMY